MGSCPFWIPAILANKCCCCVAVYILSETRKVNFLTKLKHTARKRGGLYSTAHGVNAYWSRNGFTDIDYTSIISVILKIVIYHYFGGRIKQTPRQIILTLSMSILYIFIEIVVFLYLLFALFFLVFIVISKNQKSDITFAARRHNVNVLLSNSTFLIFAVLVVWCWPCRR